MGDGLRRCPWCKHPPVLTNMIRDDYWYVECITPDCKCNPKTGHYETKAEAIKAWNSCADVDELSEQLPVDNAQADSRERLEADVRGICWGSAFHRCDAQRRYLDERGLDVREDIVTTNYDGHVLATVIMHLLDRQAAITSSEWCYSHDALEEELERVRAERDEWKTKCDTREFAYKQADAERKRYSEQIDELTAELDKANETGGKLMDKLIDMTAERDQLTNAINELQKRQPYCYDPEQPLDTLNTIGRYIDELTAERDEAVEAYDAHMAAHDAWHEAEDITYTRNRFSVLEEAKNERIAKLTAERDELKAELAKCEHDCGLLFDENDSLRKKLREKQRVCDVQRESFRKMEKLLADAKAADYTAMRDEAEKLSAENAHLKAENRELCMKVYGAPF